MRHVGLLVRVSMLSACGPGTPHVAPGAPSAQPASAPATSATLIDSEIDPPYPLPAPVLLHEVCSPTRVGPGGGHKVFDFDPLEIAAVPWGARARDMPRTGRPRSARPLLRQLAIVQPQLSECYRWAGWKNAALQGAMNVSFEIDEVGRLGQVAVEDRARWGELAGCVEDVLPAATARTLVPRRTRVSATLQFVRAGERPPKRPARPTRARLAGVPPAGCLLVPDAPPVDPLALPVPALTVDDAEPSGRPLVPPLRVMGFRDKSMIRATVRTNLGAVGECFAGAKARDAHLAGPVTLRVEIRPDGKTDSVAVEKTTAADPELEACLRAALVDLWYPSAVEEGPTTVHLPLVAGPAVAAPVAPAARDTTAHVEASAEAALHAGDAAAALRRFAALARQAPSCVHSLGVLRALAAARPWIDDGVMAAAADVVARAPAGECADAAAPLLARLAAQPHQVGARTLDEDLLELAVARYRLALQAPGLPNGAELRAYLADALIRLGREAEAKQVLPTGGEPKLPRF